MSETLQQNLKNRFDAQIDRALSELAAEQATETVTIPKADLVEVRDALEQGREALRNYACHAGPTAPCRRVAHHCHNECGKPAGDAFIAHETALTKLEGYLNGKC